MIKVIRYHPRENGGEPRMYKLPKKQTTWRVDLYVKLPGKAEADRRLISLVDKMTVHDAHAEAIEKLCELVREGELVEDAYFELWAE